MNNKYITTISELINTYLKTIFNERDNKTVEIIYHSFQKLLNGDAEKYDIINSNDLEESLTVKTDDIQSKLSKINEISKDRKRRGVYYTPEDVTNYIIINSFINYINPDNDQLYDYDEGFSVLLKDFEKLKSLLLYKVVFDPTCGAGEFLLNCFKIKISLLSKIQNIINDDEIISILRTIIGNDINKESIEICKIRLFIECSNYVSDSKLNDVVNTLSSNFYNDDFVMIKKKSIPRSDIILGNPPYVEYNKIENKPSSKYGNIYADILHNSILSLNENGVYGLIVPLSYVATSRMQKLRDFVKDNINKQFILSFADRPDCLFTGVHQKLCIIFGMKNQANHMIFTTNYRHWYKSERKQLFSRFNIIENQFRYNGFIPKIGNLIEKNIFKKVFTDTRNNINELSKTNDELSIYLNMRATFYIKAFSYNPGSKEYKKFSFDKLHHSFILCLLNSSLYFLFWTIISDCWHITSKEIKHMYIPEIEFNEKLFTLLAKQLEDKLETTKKYIGTVQSEYEYKHKDCFDILNIIDDELAKIYNLTDNELDYVKKFAYKYRVGMDI